MVASLALQAQDIHFSQFYNMPTQMNPALTGHIEGSYRVNLIYRNQWYSITQGGVFSTPGLSFDMNFKMGESRNSIGGGLLVMNDQTGGGDFNNLWLLGSVAYHLSLDKKEKNYLSFGVQGGYVSKRLDANSQIFADQLDGSGNPTINTMENFANTDISGGDLRAGLVFSSYPNAKMNYKLGFSYMHLLQTEEIFLDGSTENNLPGRIVFFGEGEFMTKNPKFRIMPEVLFMNQASVNEINVTSNFGYKVNPSFGLIFGAGYRVLDAAIANVGFEYKGVEFLASYDVNLSDLSNASRYQGGFEISLAYVGRIIPKQKANLPCIRFY